VTAAGANDVDAPTDNGIEVEGLVKDFKGGVRAVDGIDLRVAPGDLAAQRSAQRGEGRLGNEAKSATWGEPASPLRSALDLRRCRLSLFLAGPPFR